MVRRFFLVGAMGLLAGCPHATTPAAPTPVDEPPAAITITRDGNELVLSQPLTFDAGSTDLAADDEPALQALRAYLNEHPDVTVLRLEGHLGEDNGMADPGNDSGERAFAVGAWLADHGVACERLLAAAFGTSKPIMDNGTPEGRAANNRITIVVAELRGHAIGGMPLDGGAMAAVDVCPLEQR